MSPDAPPAAEAGADWTGEKVLAAMRAWARERGEPPRMSDWARADRGRWPPPNLVARLFERWSEAVTAAGLTPWRGGRERRRHETLSPSGTTSEAAATSATFEVALQLLSIPGVVACFGN